MTAYTPMKTILAAVDFSGSSNAVLEDAKQMALAFGAGLVIVNVLHQRLFDELERAAGRFGEMANVAEQAVAALEDERAERLAQLISEVDLASVPHKSFVTKGLPWERVLDIAEKENVDLIVMGAKGRGSADTPLRGIRFGSSAEKVFRRAQCRVMFLR